MRRTVKCTLGSIFVLVTMLLADASMGLTATASSPPQRHISLLQEADEQLAARSYADAAGLFAMAYRSLPREERASSVGEFTVTNAYEAALEHFRQTGDTEVLIEVQALLGEFLHFVESASGELPRVDPVEVRGRHANIDALLDQAAQSVDWNPVIVRVVAVERTAPNRPMLDELLPSVDPRPSEPVPTVRVDRRKLGTALVAAGGTVLAGGIAMIIVGARQVPWYLRRLESSGLDRYDPRYQPGLVEAERIGEVDMTVGVSLLAMGAAAAAVGVVFLVDRAAGRRGRKEPLAARARR